MKRNTFIWKTASINKETIEAVTIVFSTKGVPFQYNAGQFINLSVMIDGINITRSYSLSSSPGEDENPSITVKKIDGGIMSSYIFDHAEEIIEYKVEGPLGSFYADENLLSCKHVYLVAGGSGITPLFAILKYLLKTGSCKVFLIYSTKSWDKAFYRSVLLNLERSFADRFQVQYVFTNNNEGSGFTGNSFIKGRLSKLTLKKTLKNFGANTGDKAHYFLCGPSGLIKMSEEVISASGIPDTNIHKEFFVAPEETSTTEVLPQVNLEVLLQYYDQINLIKVAPGETILEAALKDKIPVNHSCRSGFCGVCVGKVTSGKVHLKNNFALQEQQLQERYTLLCQAQPLNNSVTVEVGRNIII